jgi:hypothetical protein
VSVVTTTPNQYRSLTTAAAVVARLGLGSTPAYMAQLVLAASGAIERYCGRIFAQQTYDETVNGNDHDVLLLTHAPIVGTPTITADGSPVVDFSIEDAKAATLYREVGWARAAWVGWNDSIETDRMASRYPRFVVSYTAGYDMPEDNTPTLPPDIEEAAIMTTMQWYRAEKRGTDVKSKKVGDLVLTYGGSGEDHYGIPAMARALLPRRVV